MKRGWLLAVASLPVLMSAGCWFSPEPSYETHFYGLMDAEAQSWPFTVAGVLNESGVVNRMVYRTGSGERVVDEYRRWLQSPEVMLANYFRDGAQTERAGLPVFELRVYRFDADLSRKTVNLGVEWRRADAGASAAEWVNFRCEAPLEDATSEAMVKAFSVCAEQLGKELEHK